MYMCHVVCCGVVQCGAVCCIVLQCVAVCYSALQCVVVHCSVSQEMRRECGRKAQITFQESYLNTLI